MEDDDLALTTDTENGLSDNYAVGDDDDASHTESEDDDDDDDDAKSRQNGFD